MPCAHGTFSVQGAFSKSSTRLPQSKSAPNENHTLATEFPRALPVKARHELVPELPAMVAGLMVLCSGASVLRRARGVPNLGPFHHRIPPPLADRNANRCHRLRDLLSGQAGVGALHRSTANMRHWPGTPLRDWLKRSLKRNVEPTTKSFTVLDTNTSPAAASAATRAPM
jgi:hypothetical protein